MKSMTQRDFVLGGMFALAGVSAAQAAPAKTGFERIAELREITQGARPYEVLKQVFDEAHDPMTLADVDRLAVRCVFAKYDAVEPEFIPSLRRFKVDKVVEPEVPGQPAKGPLFPATPGKPAKVATKEGVISLNSDNLNDVQSYVRRNFDFITVDNSPNELVTRYELGSTETSAPIELTVRRNGNLLNLRLVFLAGLERQFDFYGYCWNQ